MKTMNACDVTPESLAWVWTDAGDGKLYPVNYYRPDGWLVCGLWARGDSWTTLFCVCADSPCYVFESDDERAGYEAKRRQQLADNWARESALSIAMAEAELAG